MRSPRTVRAVACLSVIYLVAACASSVPAPSATPPVTVPTDAPATSTPATQAPAIPTGGVAMATSAPDGSTPVHLVKDCSTFVGEIPSYCSISASNLAAVPVGAKVVYLGPLLDNQHFLSSNVLIDDAHGNTATGYCIFDARPTEERGFCAFSTGTGALAGFIAILKVTIDDAGEWHLDGDAYGSSASPGPS